MNELRPVKTYLDWTTLSLNYQTKFRLNEISKKKHYFNSKIQERETSKKLRKSIASLDYMDKVLTVLSGIFGGVSIISHASVIGIPAGIIKKSLKETKKKKKHSKIIMLAGSKLNSIKTLMSQALIDLDISHEEFKAIVNEKEKYDQMKESVRNTKSKSELSKIVEIHRFKKIIFFVSIYKNGCCYSSGL